MTIQVGKSPVGGDGLFSLKAFKAGKTILVVERPAFVALDVPRLPEACSGCFAYAAGKQVDLERPILKLQACAGCHMLRYCSKQCQSQSWKRDHKYECKLLGRLGQKGALPNAARILVQMMNAVIHNNDESYKDMQSHYDEIVTAAGDRLDNLKILATGVHEYSGKPLRKDMVCNLMAMVYTNALGLTTPTMDSIGLAVDPLIAKANHSCSPNAYVVFDGPRLLLRSTSDIRKDEEITIQYVDILNCRVRRRRELRERYYFDCRCSRCNAEEDDTVADQVEESASEILVHATKGQLDSKNAVSALKTGMDLIRGGHHWPDHKQPLQTLHHELYLALLSSQRWLEAFRRGLFIYFTIHPIVYPDNVQPTRTIHVYSLAKLAILLHSDEQARQSLGDGDKLPEQLDLAQAVILLLTEAEEALKRSHGEDNSLTREAKGKAEDMRRQLAGKLISQPEAQGELLKKFARD